MRLELERTNVKRIELFFAAAIVVGAVLRLSWMSDIEFKGDEQWLFERSQNVGITEPWPAIGIYGPGSVNHPGFSIWVLAALARVFAAHDPVALARSVALFNILAFVGLFFFVTRCVDEKEREAWFWGGALAAVSPIAVLLSRKIWLPPLFPPFLVVFLYGFWKRETHWGAFLWGLACAFVPQVHMSGFFAVAGFVGWEIATGWCRNQRRRTQWFAWIAGTALGALNLIPWIRMALRARNNEGTPKLGIENIETLQFYRQWVSDTLGVGSDYAIGAHFLDFLKYPIIENPARYAGPRWHGLYPMLYVHGLAFAAGAFLLWKCVERGRSTWLSRPWSSVVTAFRGRSETAHAVMGMLIGYGALITLANVYVWRHYMLVTFPLEWVSIGVLAAGAFAARSKRRALGVLWAAQLCISVTLLHYLHEHRGAPQSDYGTAYGARRR